MKELAEYMNEKIKSAIWRYYAFTLFSNLWFIGAILVPFFTQWGHVSLFQVQLLQSWYSLWFFICEVPTGIIADRLGRKYTLAAGALIAAFGLIWYGTIPDFRAFLVGEFLVALGNSLMSGANDALLYETLKEQGHEAESKRYFGRANSFQLFGIFIGSLLGGVIAAKYGLNMPFILSAIPTLIAGFIAWSFKEARGKKEKMEKEQIFTILKKGYSFFLSHKTLRLLAFDAMIVASAGYFVIWLYQPLLEKAGVNIVYFGLFNAILVGSEILISHNFHFLEKLFGKARNYLRFSAIATGFAFLLVALLPNVLTITIFILVAGGLGLTRSTLMSTYMQKFIPSEQRATVLSSISTCNRMAIAILNPFIGLAATHSLQLAAFLLGLFPLALFFFSPIEQSMFEQEVEVN